MPTSFRPYAPDQDLLLPPSLREWLPEGHLAYFISDVVEELDAAQQAGMQTLQLVREGTQAGTRHPCVTRFDEIHL